MNFSDKSWQQIQAEAIDYIHRLCNMIRIYDPEKKFPHLHDAVDSFNKRFATGRMRNRDFAKTISGLSASLANTLDNNYLIRAMEADRSNQPKASEGMMHFQTKSKFFNNTWDFYFRSEEAAKKAFDNITEENYILVDDIFTKCDELYPGCKYWKVEEKQKESV